jgi:hypothetical protein
VAGCYKQAGTLLPCISLIRMLTTSVFSHLFPALTLRTLWLHTVDPVLDILHLCCQNQDESELFGFTVVLPSARLLGTASGESPAPSTLRSFCFLRHHLNNSTSDRFAGSLKTESNSFGPPEKAVAWFGSSRPRS